MQIVAWLCEERRHMARGALALGIEDLFPAHGGVLVERTRWRLRGGDGQLIEVEGGELGGHEVRLAAAISGSGLRRNRILLFVVQPGVEESSRAVHLGDGHPGIPVGNGSESRPCVEVDTGEAERRWYESA